MEEKQNSRSLSSISTKDIFEIDPTEIVVCNERPRQRKDMGELEKMVESINKFGQIQPIVITKNKELVAGGRRLAACILGGLKAKVCYTDAVDPIFLREMELEENLQRKELTPAEEAIAVSELVTFKQKIYGKPVGGSKDSGFTLDDAGELIGKSRADVIKSLHIAEAIKLFPNLSECKTKSEILSAYKGLQRISDNIDALKKHEEIIKRSSEFVLVNRDAEGYLKGLADKSIDLFFTDPPYGIDIHEVAMTTGGETGGENTTTGIKYNDKEDYAKRLLEAIIPESFRLTKDTGFAFIFCAPSHFWWLREAMESVGWIVAPRPIVWIKRESGQNNQPDKWFSSAYEFILFARKVNSVLVLQGRPDWIQCDPVLPSERVHQAEKPVELCKELISRVCLPGQFMVDPCMGSGAIIEAGVRMKILSLGCDKEVESYAAAVSRMSKLNKVE